MPSADPSIQYRTTGAWGAGKGSNLTPVEVDENFWALVQAVIDVEAIEPHQITNITTSGNKMTVHVDGGGTFGPFTLPTATFHFRDAWAPETNYLLGDFFTGNDGFYFVSRDFTSNSGSVFLPLFGDGPGGPPARLVIPYPNLYGIAGFYPGLVGLGISNDSGDSAVMFSHVFAHSVYILADAPLARVVLEAAPFADTVYPIQHATFASDSPVSIGSIAIAAGEQEAVITFTDTVQFAPGDRFQIQRPESIDGLARDMSVIFPAIKGTIPEVDSSS